MRSPFPLQLARLFVTFILLALAITTVGAPLPEKKLQQLANDIERTLQAEKPQQNEVRPVNPRDSSRMLVTTLRAAIGRADFAQLQTVLEQLAAFLDSAALRDRCAQSVAEVRILGEAKEKQKLAEIDRAVKRATDAVRSATKSSDLDGILLELGKFRDMRQEQPSSGSLNSALGQMEHVIRFVTYWQDYIAQSTGGDTKAAQETLRRMAEIPPNSLIPRSEILARRYGVIGPQSPAPSSTPAEPVPLVLNKPDDLLPAIEKVTALFNTNQVYGDERSALQRFIAAMTALANAYHEFKAGLATKLEIVAANPAQPNKFDAVLAPLRAEILKLILPRYLGLPPAFKPNPDEGVQEFLQRVVDDAAEKGDFLLAAHARETQIVLREGQPHEPNENSQAALYVTAHNQEVAGQYALAVTSYQRALATGTDLVPPKIIGDRLARIKAEHPKEFETGTEAFLTPRIPMPPPGFTNSYFGPLGPPHSPGWAGPPQNPVLQVPAIAPSPNVTSSPASQPASTP